MKTVLMATTEFSPFVKAGGLGDVVGALPFALRKEGVDARVIMPLYSFLPARITESLKFVKETYVDLGWRKIYCGILEMNYNGLPMYFIDNKSYFGGDKLYYDIESDIERFAFFCSAVLHTLPHIDFAPDVIHCHDWHTSLIPILYHAHFKKVQYYSSIKTVLTVHNLKYQGICNKFKLYDILGINDMYSVAPSLSFGHDIVNCMKGGISVADKLTTVSDTYAREIRDPYYGEGLDWLLKWRGHDLVGIVNGIDNRSYDPSRDGTIAEKYTKKTAPQIKKRNKTALQADLGLAVDPDAPVIALISRLVAQKGIDLITCVFDDIMAIEAPMQTQEAQEELMALSAAGAQAAQGALAAAGMSAVQAAQAALDAKEVSGAQDTHDTPDAPDAQGGHGEQGAPDAQGGHGEQGEQSIHGEHGEQGGQGEQGAQPDGDNASPDHRPQFVMLGTGETAYENFFRWKELQYPGRVAASLTFDDALARKIYAGADFLLMPSIFEPCGISQMIAMRYGTVPIVRETGGLTDTVHAYNEYTGEGNGYSFKNINAHDMLYTIRRALSFYPDACGVQDKLIDAVMNCDFSWDKSAKRYKELYEHM